MVEGSKLGLDVDMSGLAVGRKEGGDVDLSVGLKLEIIVAMSGLTLGGTVGLKFGDFGVVVDAAT